MKVIDLRKALEGVPDNLEVVVIGHFGEGIRINPSGIRIRKKVNVVDAWWDWKNNKNIETVLALPGVDIGPEPD